MLHSCGIVRALYEQVQLLPSRNSVYIMVTSYFCQYSCVCLMEKEVNYICAADANEEERLLVALDMRWQA